MLANIDAPGGGVDGKTGGGLGFRAEVGGRDLTIDLQMRGLDQASAAYIAQCLRQIVSVNTVLVSEKR